MHRFTSSGVTRRSVSLLAAGAAALGLTSVATAQGAITLHGAVQFADDHAFNRALVRFEELVKKYYGKPINFVLHKNSELGLEKDYFAYMNQGKAVDYAIVSPAHMSTFSKAAPFIDAPFLFRDLAHWNKVLDADLLKPIADEVAQKGEVMLIGYAGGGVRNILPTSLPATSQSLRASKCGCRALRSGRAPSAPSAWHPRSLPTTRFTTASKTRSSKRARTKPLASKP